MDNFDQEHFKSKLKKEKKEVLKRRATGSVLNVTDNLVTYIENYADPWIRGRTKPKPKASDKFLEEKRMKDRERQRQRRAKLSVEQLWKKREYDRIYKAKRKAEGSWKLRGDMNEREKRRDRQQSRERMKRYREKLKLNKVNNT